MTLLTRSTCSCLLVFSCGWMALTGTIARADSHAADSGDFPLNLLDLPSGFGSASADSADFGLNLYGVNRGWADSGDFAIEDNPPPSPELVSIRVLGAVQLNVPFVVQVVLRNNGGAGDHGGITISFPDLTDSDSSTPPYNSSKADVDVAGGTSFPSVRWIESGCSCSQNPTSCCLCNDTACNIQAQHLFVEGDEAAWDYAETQTLTLTITPKQAGSLTLRIRGWIAAPGTGYGPPTYRAPASTGESRELDQQGYWAETLSVTAKAGSNVTYVTHGYQVDFDPVSEYPTPPSWLVDMADAINTRASWANAKVFSWNARSGNWGSGWAVAAGEHLAALVYDEVANNGVDQVHLIGHSRGSGVIAEASRRLGAVGIGVSDGTQIHLTMLDPVDAGNDPVNSDWERIQNLNDPVIRIYENVCRADNYYRVDIPFPDLCPIPLTCPRGTPMDGAANLALSGLYHSGVYDWYQDSIDNYSVNDGYYWSSGGGGWFDNDFDLRVSGSKSAPASVVQWVSNGYFQEIDPLGKPVWTGYRWEQPDGVGGWIYVDGVEDGVAAFVTLGLRPDGIPNNYCAHFDVSMGDPVVMLRHQPILIPPNANALTFELYCGTNGMSTEVLRVRFAESEIWSATMEGYSSSGFVTVSVPISSYAGQVGELSFEYDTTGTELPNWILTDIWIDNIRIQTAGSSTPPSNLALKAEDDTGVPGDNITKLNRPRITGQATNGCTVRLYVDNTVIGMGTASEGSFEIQVSTALRDGFNAIAATAQCSGEQESSPSSPLTIRVDTQAPPPPSVPDLMADSDTGHFRDDNVTFERTPVFQGTAEANSDVTLYDGAVVIGTAQSTDGNWQITSSQLAEDVHQISAMATDTAGNGSSHSSALAVSIDATPPVLTDPSVIPTSCWPVGRVFDLSMTAVDALSGLENAWKPEAILVKGAVEIHIELDPAGGNVYGESWDSDNREPGTYDVSFQAWDLAGNSRLLEEVGSVCLLVSVTADFDKDGDVDQTDFSLLDACFSGPAVPYAGDCGAKDLDGDSDVDQSDFGIFQRCYNGENNPADQSCAGSP